MAQKIIDGLNIDASFIRLNLQHSKPEIKSFVTVAIKKKSIIFYMRICVDAKERKKTLITMIGNLNYFNHNCVSCEFPKP